MLREMRMQLRNLLLRQRRDGESRRSARLDGACRSDRSAGPCGAARTHGSHGSRGSAGAYRSYRTNGSDGSNRSHRSHGRNGSHGRERNGAYGSDGSDRSYGCHRSNGSHGRERNGAYGSDGSHRAGYIRETKTAIRKSKKAAEHEILPLFLHTVWFLCHSTTPTFELPLQINILP